MACGQFFPLVRMVRSYRPLRRGPLSASLDTLPEPCQAKGPHQLMASADAGAKLPMHLFRVAHPPLKTISTPEKSRAAGCVRFPMIRPQLLAMPHRHWRWPGPAWQEPGARHLDCHRAIHPGHTLQIDIF